MPAPTCKRAANMPLRTTFSGSYRYARLSVLPRTSGIFARASHRASQLGRFKSGTKRALRAVDQSRARGAEYANAAAADQHYMYAAISGSTSCRSFSPSTQARGSASNSSGKRSRHWTDTATYASAPPSPLMRPCVLTPHRGQKQCAITSAPKRYSVRASDPSQRLKLSADMGAIQARDFLQIEQLHRSVGALRSTVAMKRMAPQ